MPAKAKPSLNPEATPFVPGGGKPPAAADDTATAAAAPAPRVFGPAVRWLPGPAPGQLYSPPPVTGATLFALGSTLYVTGGWMAGGEWLSSIHALHLPTRSWRPVIVLQPPPRSFHGSGIVPHGSTLYVFGGAEMGHYSNRLHTVALRTARALRFTVTCERAMVVTAPLLQCFADHFSVPAQSVVVLSPFHTDSRTAVTRVVVVLDPQTHRSEFLAKPFIPGPWKAAGCFAVSELEDTTADVAEWSEPIPTTGEQPPPRTAAQGAVVGGTLYVFGGRSPTVWLNDLYALDLATRTWRAVPSGGGPPPHPHNCLVASARRLLVVCRQQGTVYALDTPSGAWRLVPQASATPQPKRTEASLVAYEGQLFSFGGVTYPLCFYNDLHALDLADFRWAEPIFAAGEIPTPTRRASAVGARGRLYFFGGQVLSHRPCATNELQVVVVDAHFYARLRALLLVSLRLRPLAAALRHVLPFICGPM